MGALALAAGRDVYAAAKTGSGKTAAFALPLLQKLCEDPFGIFAVVLSPTRYAASRERERERERERGGEKAQRENHICREKATQREIHAHPPQADSCCWWVPSELAFQVADQFKAFGKPMNVRVTVVVGGTGMAALYTHALHPHTAPLTAPRFAPTLYTDALHPHTAPRSAPRTAPHIAVLQTQSHSPWS
jgi:hypothetical protein